MLLLFSLFLFLITLLGGSVPLWSTGWREQRMKYLLAFSGSFLLSITLLHLVPETMSEMGPGHLTGGLILAGFFLQQIIQRITHGVEHGHAHIHAHEPVAYIPVFAGLTVHAISEGLPLGISYNDTATLPSLYLAVALHKLPEAMLITSLVFIATGNKAKSWRLLILFSLTTPLSALLTTYLGSKSAAWESLIHLSVPVVAGAFLHIATTIFFESGTKSHDMNRNKWLATLGGIAAALLTLLGDNHVH
jgi:zinc and cadmium transporter